MKREISLREHLRRAEIEYIAKHGGGYPETFKWGADIEAELKTYGFRIIRTFEADGVFVELAGGIAVFLDGDGYICPPAKRDKR